MARKMAAVLLCALLAFGMAACSAGGETKAEGGRLRVMVSFNALKEFAQAVGGDRAEVTALIPDGTEAHDFELKAQDLAALAGADVFVYNGLGMESWAEKAVEAAGNEDLIVVVAS